MPIFFPFPSFSRTKHQCVSCGVVRCVAEHGAIERLGLSDGVGVRRAALLGVLRAVEQQQQASEVMRIEHAA